MNNKNYKRRYWNVSEKTRKDILKIYSNNLDELESKKIVYGEIIELAIDNLLYDLKTQSLGDIKNNLY